MKMRILVALLVAVTLLGALSGCQTIEPDGTIPSSSIQNTTNHAEGVKPTTGTPENDSTDDETVSGTENTEPTTQPTEPATEPTEPTTEPTEPTPEPSTPPDEPSEPGVCKHKYGEWSTIKAATCDTDGTKTRQCTGCGDTQTQSVSATGHNWDEGKVIVQPTGCSDIGSKLCTCKTCGKTKTEQINGNHSFGQWQWEEYSYTVDYGKDHPGYVPGFPTTETYTSHRKIRSCTNCGYQENDGTPDHICQKGYDNHVVTTVKEGTCTVKARMRSTCTICGWYVEYDGRTTSHNLEERKIHISDYGPTTNELDAIIYECVDCGEQSIWYEKGKGFTSLNVSEDFGISISGVDAFEYAITSDDFRLLEHPTWQTVYRNIVVNSAGYVTQFDYTYWTADGKQYTCTIDVSDVPGWFAEYNMVPPVEEYEGMNYHLTYRFKVKYGFVYPSSWVIGWTG